MLYGRILEKLPGILGLRSATLSGHAPISDVTWNSPFFLKGVPRDPASTVFSSLEAVAPGYFETLEIALLQGRTIRPQDSSSSEKVVVINQTVASKFFPAGDAIGHYLNFAAPDVPGDWRIVGVVADSKYNSPREAPQNMIYFPLVQLSGESLYAGTIELKASGDPMTIANSARAVLTGIDASLPVTDVQTLDQAVNHSMTQEILVAQLSGFFSALALLLACIGLYGVMTYNVVRRTGEIGIRLALGANIGQVLWMVMSESLLLLTTGIAIGVPATLAAMRLVQSQLFQVSPADPSTIAFAVAIVSLVAILSGYFPARRAAKIDPLKALRCE